MDEAKEKLQLKPSSGHCLSLTSSIDGVQFVFGPLLCLCQFEKQSPGTSMTTLGFHYLYNQAFNKKNEKKGEKLKVIFSYSPYTSAIHMDACLLTCSNMPSCILA